MCGGIGEAELRESGAVAVYGNPAELLSSYDDSALSLPFES
jgi:hypothetical protein